MSWFCRSAYSHSSPARSPYCPGCGAVLLPFPTLLTPRIILVVARWLYPFEHCSLPVLSWLWCYAYTHSSTARSPFNPGCGAVLNPILALLALSTFHPGCVGVCLPFPTHCASCRAHTGYTSSAMQLHLAPPNWRWCCSCSAVFPS